MIVHCVGCQAQYEVREDKIPPEGLCVSCPKCGAVFDLKPLGEAAEGLASSSYTAAEVASFLKIRPEIVRKWISSGDLGGETINGQWLISAPDLVAFLARKSYQRLN